MRGGFVIICHVPKVWTIWTVWFPSLPHLCTSFRMCKYRERAAVQPVFIYKRSSSSSFKWARTFGLKNVAKFWPGQVVRYLNMYACKYIQLVFFLLTRKWPCNVLHCLPCWGEIHRIHPFLRIVSFALLVLQRRH